MSRRQGVRNDGALTQQWRTARGSHDIDHGNRLAPAPARAQAPAQSRKKRQTTRPARSRATLKECRNVNGEALGDVGHSVQRGVVLPGF